MDRWLHRCISIFTLSLSHIFSFSQEQLIPLHDGWAFQQVGKEQWYPAQVPGTVHDDLLRQGLIPDPMRNSNVDSVQWIEHEDWTYRRTITVADTLFKHANIDLVFKGLDTFAEVYLNDSLLGKADNMFRSWEWPIKDLLKLGKNELKVIFRSVIKEGAKLRDAYGIQLPHDNDPSGVSPYVRKAAYQFGWDFAPRLVGCGIWKEVELRCWEESLTDGLWITSARAGELVSISPQLLKASKLRLDGDFEVWFDGQLVSTQPARRIWKHPIGVDLKGRATGGAWWPQGSGDQKIHRLSVVHRHKGKILSRTERNHAFGWRAWNYWPDDSGAPFNFSMNDVPVFIKGCNIIPPLDNSDKGWIDLVRVMQSSGMNMARVWAGGVYPPEAFFQACDTSGILVWQDMMLANLVPSDRLALQYNVWPEVVEQIYRIMRHPSLALFCGNNELRVAWNNWGWQDRYQLHGSDSASVIDANERLWSTDEIGQIANGLGRSWYTPTSPLSNWGNAEGLRSGDLHYWGVWHGDSAFSSFANNVGRFVSEYGFQSYPDSITLAHYIDPEFLYLGSPMLAKRQKSYKTDKPIWTAIERELGETPTTLGRFIDCSQIVQAEAYRQAIWAHRTNQPHCMGTLYWQLNDVWAAPTWSTIDVDFRWKAAHFEVKRSYAERVLAFLPTANGTTTLELWSDTEVLGDTVIVEFWSVQGELVRREKKPLTGKGRLVVGSWPKAAWEAGMMAYAFGADTEPRMYSTMRSSNGRQRNEGLSMAPIPGQSDVWEVRTTSPIRSVKLVVGPDDHVSDNWFPLVPGHPVRITVEHGVRSTGQVPTASIFRR